MKHAGESFSINETRSPWFDVLHLTRQSFFFSCYRPVNISLVSSKKRSAWQGYFRWKNLRKTNKTKQPDSLTTPFALSFGEKHMVLAVSSWNWMVWCAYIRFMLCVSVCFHMLGYEYDDFYPYPLTKGLEEQLK